MFPHNFIKNFLSFSNKLLFFFVFYTFYLNIHLVRKNTNISNMVNNINFIMVFHLKQPIYTIEICSIFFVISVGVNILFYERLVVNNNSTLSINKLSHVYMRVCKLYFCIYRLDD